APTEAHRDGLIGCIPRKVSRRPTGHWEGACFCPKSNQSGTPLHVLQELGGWSDFAMVKKYAHLAPEHLAEHAARIESGIRSVPHIFRHTA
ncbi:tyrosine-type recombinase/integrase, partial [Allochromatium palmeri]|nr:tyrosine-type recombinase/integrase [Allochromatium palmeri]